MNDGGFSRKKGDGLEGSLECENLYTEKQNTENTIPTLCQFHQHYANNSIFFTKVCLLQLFCTGSLCFYFFS